MCSIIRVGERLYKVLGQMDLAHCTQVSDRCPLGYLFFLFCFFVFFFFFFLSDLDFGHCRFILLGKL